MAVQRQCLLQGLGGLEGNGRDGELGFLCFGVLGGALSAAMCGAVPCVSLMQRRVLAANPL